jgi:hypothetical protein
MDDIEKIFNEAKELTAKANTYRQWRLAGNAWLKLKFEGQEFYFQDKLDYCLDMAEKVKRLNKSLGISHRYDT